MSPVCPDCERFGSSEQCAALFQRLLALEFQYAHPWGRLHGVTVPVFALQHPGRFAVADPTIWLTSLHLYVVDGLAHAERVWASSRGRGLPRPADLPPLVDGPARYGVSIADVAGSAGDFPAGGHARRVEAWARQTYADLVGDPT